MDYAKKIKFLQQENTRLRLQLRLSQDLMRSFVKMKIQLLESLREMSKSNKNFVIEEKKIAAESLWSNKYSEIDIFTTEVDQNPPLPAEPLSNLKEESYVSKSGQNIARSLGLG